MAGEMDGADADRIKDVGDTVAALAAWHGIVVPAACAAGVAANLAILREHMTLVRIAAGEAPFDPAELLTP